MKHLVAILDSGNCGPSVAEDEAMCREIDALNDEMKAEGCWCQEFRWRQQIGCTTGWW